MSMGSGAPAAAAPLCSPASAITTSLGGGAALARVAATLRVNLQNEDEEYRSLCCASKALIAPAITCNRSRAGDRRIQHKLLLPRSHRMGLAGFSPVSTFF